MSLENNICMRNGTMGISTGYIGILQSVETLKIILGLNKKCKNLLIFYDLITGEIKKKEINLNRSYDNYRVEQQKRNSSKIILNNDKYLIIDLRAKSEFQKQHIKGSINIPLLNLKINKTIQIIKYYFKYTKIGLYCNENNRSIIGSYILKNYQIINFILNRNMIG